MKVLVKNKKAFHNYEVIERFEAGISLIGPEVKSIMNGVCSIAESFVKIRNGEAFIQQMHITRYGKVDGFNVNMEEARERKLLLKKAEIKKLDKNIKEKGFTVIPLALIYSDTRKIKLEIALCRGKNKGDKRQDLKDKDERRELRRVIG